MIIFLIMLTIVLCLVDIFYEYFLGGSQNISNNMNNDYFLFTKV
jgi:hypothetical protein